MDKLFIIESAKDLRDLKTPPGNRLEKLTGDRKGQYAIRINNQWRICFDWHEGDAYNVEIADYHLHKADAKVLRHPAGGTMDE